MSITIIICVHGQITSSTSMHVTASSNIYKKLLQKM
jgi:hypothetical protein